MVSVGGGMKNAMTLTHQQLRLILGDGIGDLRGLTDQVPYFKNLSVGAVRLNSIFASKIFPEKFGDVMSLFDISPQLGTSKDLENLVVKLHEQNISLILDLPLYPIYNRLQPSTIENITRDEKEAGSIEEFRRPERSIIDDNQITNVMRFWLSKGVDGFYLKGLENFADDQYLGENLREWKYVLGKERIMIVSRTLIDRVSNELAAELLNVIDLVDVYLDISNGTQHIQDTVIKTLESNLKPSEEGPWIHWSINGIDRGGRVASVIHPNASLAALLMEFMLPGTPSILYGDEISMDHVEDANKDHKDNKNMYHLPTMSFSDQSSFTSRHVLPWIPRAATVHYSHLEYVTEAISLRTRTPSLYKNSITKDGNEAHGNTHIRANQNDLLIIERTYPRRNTFISITNLGSDNLTIDISALYYSGELVLGPAKRSKVFFSNFKIRSLETVIIRLDK